MPLISVVVPVYNTEKYLARCLESITQQTFSDFEVILINDGSTDNSPSICEEYANKYPHFRYFSKANEGLATTRNFALSKVKGQYIYNVDSDDYIEKNALEVLANATNDGFVDIVFCNYYEEFTDRSVFKPLPFSDLNEDADFYLRKVMTGDFPGYNFSKLIKRSLINGLKYVDGADMWEDVTFTLKILTRAERIAFVPEALYHYILYNTNSILRSKGNIEKKLKRQFTQLQDNLKSVLDFYGKDLCQRYRNELQFYKFLSKSPLTSSLAKEDWELWNRTDPETNFLWRKKSNYGIKTKIIFFLVSHRLYFLYSILMRYRNR